MTRRVTGPHKIGESDKMSAYFRRKLQKEEEVVRGMIGNAPKLAPGYENPMWAIQGRILQENGELGELFNHVPPLLDKKPKKKKKTTYNLDMGIVIGDKVDETPGEDDLSSVRG